MLQRLIALLLGVLGLASIGLGVASATAWRGDDPLVAGVTLPADHRLAVGDPGVLELAGDPVTITITAADSPVVLAVGRDTDVAGWAGQDGYVRLTGLSGWHAIATDTVDAPAPEASDPAADDPAADSPAADDPAAEAPAEAESPAADPESPTVADPTGSDLWVAEVDGDGTASLTWPAQAGRWSLVAASLGETAPTVELSWPRTVTTPWLWPGIVLGVLLLAVAAILAVRLWRADHEEDDPQWQVVTTGMIAVVPGATGPGDAGQAVPAEAATPPLMTRRQLREAEAAAAAARRGRGGRTPTGTVPVVPTATSEVPVVRAQPSEADGVANDMAPHAPNTVAVDALARPAPAAPGGPATSANGTSGADARTARQEPVLSPSAPADAARPGEGTSRADAWRRTWGIAEAAQTSEPPAADALVERSGADDGADDPEQAGPVKEGER